MSGTAQAEKNQKGQMRWVNKVDQKNQENPSNFNKVAYSALRLLPAAKTDAQLDLPMESPSPSMVSTAHDGRV